MQHCLILHSVVICFSKNTLFPLVKKNKQKKNPQPTTKPAIPVELRNGFLIFAIVLILTEDNLPSFLWKRGLYECSVYISLKFETCWLFSTKFDSTCCVATLIE